MKKSWLNYFVYGILIFGVIYTGNYLELYFKGDFITSFSSLLVLILMNVILGVLLGLEHLISEFRKSGRWKINLPKLLLLALPSIYLSMSYFFSQSGNSILWNLIGFPAKLFVQHGMRSFGAFYTIFGYFLATSFYRESDFRR